MLIQGMFDEIPRYGRYNKAISGGPTVRNYHQMLAMLNHVIQSAPDYSERKNRMSFVGVPMNAVLVWGMGTPSGHAAFVDPEVNRMFQKILNVWGAYLQSPESAYVLGEDTLDWFGPTAKKDLEDVGNLGGKTNYTIDEMFVTNPEAPNRGFKSWDDFFTRHFQDGIRPVAGPDNDSVIINSCESKPYTIKRDVKARDAFWIKEQPYSVQDMFGRDPVADQFVGGTVYQAFLSALSYHRWHAPVSGKVVKTYVINGTYFSEPLYTGISDPKNHTYIDGQGVVTAEAYLTAMATRAVIIIEADNPAIGQMAFIGVGMVEVSTCHMSVKEGQHVNKGDEIGMFHFGGSTHCLMFRNGVNVDGFPGAGGEENFPVREQVAVVHD